MLLVLSSKAKTHLWLTVGLFVVFCLHAFIQLLLLQSAIADRMGKLRICDQ